MAKNTGIPGPAARMLTELKIRNCESSSAHWDELEGKLEATVSIYGSDKAEKVRSAFKSTRQEAELGRVRRAAMRAVASGTWELLDDQETVEGFTRPGSLFRLRLDTDPGVVLLADVCDDPTRPVSSCKHCGRSLAATSLTMVAIEHKERCRLRA